MLRSVDALPPQTDSSKPVCTFQTCRAERKRGYSGGTDDLPNFHEIRDLFKQREDAWEDGGSRGGEGSCQ